MRVKVNNSTKKWVEVHLKALLKSLRLNSLRKLVARQQLHTNSLSPCQSRISPKSSLLCKRQTKPIVCLSSSIKTTTAIRCSNLKPTPKSNLTSQCLMKTTSENNSSKNRRLSRSKRERLKARRLRNSRRLLKSDKYNRNRWQLKQDSSWNSLRNCNLSKSPLQVNNLASSQLRKGETCMVLKKKYIKLKSYHLQLSSSKLMWLLFSTNRKTIPMRVDSEVVH